MFFAPPHRDSFLISCYLFLISSSPALPSTVPGKLFVCASPLFFFTPNCGHIVDSNFAPIWPQKPASVWQRRSMEPRRPWISAVLSKPQRRDERIYSVRRNQLSPLRRSRARRLAPDICHPAVAERRCCQSASHLLPVTVAQHQCPPSSLPETPPNSSTPPQRGGRRVRGARLSDAERTTR